MDGKDIYAEVKAGARKIEDLSDRGLRELGGHLARKGKINGRAGAIWSRVLGEGFDRFMRQKQAETPRTSEGTEALTDFVTIDPDAPDA